MVTTSSKDTQRKFKWFWAWQDEKEETWLSEMSSQGWHLLRVDGPGFYTFQSGAAADYVYRLDFQADPKLDKHEYLGLFADTGWEHLGNMSGWHYFRKAVQPGESSEIFSDNDSKIAKYRRLLTYMLAFAPIYLIVFLDLPDPGASTFRLVVDILLWILMGLFIVAALLLLRRINQLQKKKL